jgi:hypothetical protein
LLEVDETSIVIDGAFQSQKLAQILNEQGFQAGDLVENGFCAKSFWLALEYFAYDSEAEASGAKHLTRAFGRVGIMTAFTKLEAKP